jgi:hypothetical protein
VTLNTGEIEWYTPPEYLDRVRAMLGDIDLDPASSEIAQETVKAKHYFTRVESSAIQRLSLRFSLSASL